jgi:hypothetical protein
MMSVNDLPDYHFKPLALTNNQIENPTSVILDFFSNFHLPDFREEFKQMFEDSLHKETVDPQMHYQTFIEVNKLVEACWVVREAINEKEVTRLVTVPPVPEKRLKLPTIWLPLNPNLMPAPNTDGNSTAGSIIKINGEPGLVVDRISAPLFGHIDGIIEVNGESMAPTFINGCRVGIVRLSDNKLINWGSCCYIIDKNWCAIVRRVYQGDTSDKLLLLADNPDQELFPPAIRSWDQIEAIYNIKLMVIKQ